MGNTFTDLQRCIDIYEARQMWIENNTFSSTSYFYYDAMAVYIATRTLHVLSIRNNTFRDYPKALSVDLRNVAPNDALTIIDNRFFDHTAGPVVLLQLSNYKATSYVCGNVFRNNAGNYASMLYVRNYSPTSTEAVTVVDNFFDNPSAAYDVTVKIPYLKGHAMYAVRNWWGGASSSHVRSRIFDHASDSNRATVQFEPYRLTKETDSLSQTENGFIRENGIIGGVVEEDTILEKKQTSYVVEEGIVVPAGVTLTIEGGVTLLFRVGGITVEGMRTHCFRNYLPF